MKENIKGINGSVSRRETLTLLFSAGVLGVPFLKQFGSDTSLFSTDKQSKKMKHPINHNEPVMKTIGILGGSRKDAKERKGAKH